MTCRYWQNILCLFDRRAILMLNMIIMLASVRSIFESYIGQGHFIGSYIVQCTLEWKTIVNRFLFSVFFFAVEKNDTIKNA